MMPSNAKSVHINVRSLSPESSVSPPDPLRYLPAILTFAPATFINLSPDSADMSDDFQKNTEVFLNWLSEVGVKISPKAALADLRADGRGRALSMFFVTLLMLCYV